MTVLLSAIGQHLGPKVEINQDLNYPGQEGLISELRQDGFRWFGKSDLNIVGMATAAIADSLKAAELDPSEIDAVIFCTESFWDTSSFNSAYDAIAPHQRIREAILSDLSEVLGLGNAMPYANWLSACGNFTSALALAKGLVASGQHENIMVVLSDRVNPNIRRIPQHAMTIFSDAAAAFVFGKASKGFAVERIVQQHSASILRARNERNVLLRGRAMISAFYELSSEINKGTYPTLSGHRILVTDNFHSMSLSFLCEGLAIDSKRLVFPTKEFGHCFAIDCLLSLSAIRAALAVGDLVGVLSIGTADLGFISLRYTQ